MVDKKTKPREVRIKQMLDAEKDKNSQLAVACKAFLEAREQCRSGQDIVNGLFQLDGLEQRIKELLHG